MKENDYDGKDSPSQLTVLATYLDDFKKQLLHEVRTLLREGYVPAGKKWIKSAELKEELDISHGKLQTMRKARAISYTWFGGTILYKREEIEDVLEKNTVARNEKK